jgi:hypothetical protein
MENTPELLTDRINQLEQKIDAIYVSVEKTRKYFQGMLIATVVMFVLPILGVMIAIPSFLSMYSTIDTSSLQ